ncbi:hypothetical protein [Vibrio sonorensis]|uniref:hypothetical protein n=1 Tax=Vibrio sonorensis TaxID=1004316 RepID=UPI0008D96158|nr:hypothetical protein [Vibrio sonorensis]
MMLKYVFASLLTLTLCGCFSFGIDTSDLAAVNEQYAKKQSPLRLVIDDKNTDNASIRIVESWAGTPSKTAMDRLHQSLIFKKIYDKCGYDESAWLETRVIQHDEFHWEEVWVFKDQASFRDDKRSGFVVVASFNEYTNHMQSMINGDCHTAKGPVYVFDT